MVIPGDAVEMREQVADEAILAMASLGHGHVVIEDREVDSAVIGRADCADQRAGAVVTESARFA